MRFFHTLWTAPQTEDSVASNIVNFTTSAALVKRMGGELVLHTDDFGYEMLKHIPYDSIYVDLNDLDKNLANYFWAYGKLYATSLESIGSIHIDGDVFLKNPQLAQLFDQECDLLVQGTEDENSKQDDCYAYTQNVYRNYKLLNNMYVLWPCAYNCGIVKFNNEELKEKYLDLYFKTVNMLMKDQKNLDKYIYNENIKRNGKVILDLIAEQQFLHEIVTREEYNCKRILNEREVNAQAERIGYCHLCGPEKLYQYEGVKNLLKAVDYPLYVEMMENPVFIEYAKKVNTNKPFYVYDN